MAGVTVRVVCTEPWRTTGWLFRTRAPVATRMHLGSSDKQGTLKSQSAGEKAGPGTEQLGAQALDARPLQENRQRWNREAQPGCNSASPRRRARSKTEGPRHGVRQNLSNKARGSAFCT